MSLPTTPRIELLRAGNIAAEILSNQSNGVVIARFQHSLYLEIAEGLICVGLPRIGDGPLNCHANSLSPDLQQGRLVSVEVQRASTWTPPPWPSPFRLSVDQIDSLRDQAYTRLPKTGLSRLALDRDAVPESYEEKAAFPVLSHIRQGQVDGLDRLLGLGTGLTPAGDDVLVGILLAWRALGREFDAAELLDDAQHRTNAISQAHLAAAARGFAAAPLHALIIELHRARGALTRSLDELARIGHSSGFDALGGVILALEAELTGSLGTQN